MELEIPDEELNCDSDLTLPGWSKTGRRTRAPTRLLPPPDHHQRPLTASNDDDARDLLDLECGEVAAEKLPPKKRKLDGEGTKVMMIDDGSERERKQHKCSICSRCFSSYQALGGHKAHHSSKDQRGEGGGGGGAAVHRCTFCYKVFSKGQALGGHRRHCQGPAVSEDKAKMLSFDLNELPPEYNGSQIHESI